MTKNLLGIDPKMYRHFAGLTLAISVVIGVFADGNTQDAIAQTNQRNELKATEAKKNGKPKLADNRSPERQSRFGSESSQYGVGPDSGSGFDPGAAAPSPMAAATGPMPVWVEVDQARLARMSPEQRAAYLKKMEEERRKREAQGPVMPTPAQISALAAASAARSGSESID